ncbi:MAG: MarR family winged helix-turn-helix transcriptional regulator [Ignavibacteriales bacterium]
MDNFTTFTCFMMRGAMRKIDKYLSATLDKFGISVPQSFVLFSLLEEDGSTLKEVGSKCQIDSSSMTVLVDKLENEGLVERKLDSQDRRAIRVFLTAKGRALAEEVLLVGADFNKQVLNLLEEVKEPFRQGLLTIIEKLD